MAFYKDFKRETRQEKQQHAQARGGFDDEGRHYSDRKPGGEGRYGKPAGGEGRYGKPAGGSRYGKPTGGEGRYGKPAGEGRYGKPAGGEGRYGKPAGEGRYGKPAGEGRYGKPAGGEGRYGRPTGGEGRYGKPAGEGRYGKPAGEGRYSRPAPTEGRPTGFRDQVRSAPRGERPEMERVDPRAFKKSGNYRFAPVAPVRYNDRGAGVTPPSYAEQRQARRVDEPAYDQYRYVGPAAYQAQEDAEPELVPNENLLSGRNPIREALKSGRDIEKLMVARGELSGSAREIVQMAKERRVPVQEVDRARLDAITHNHQGMLAFASAYQYSTVEKMLELAQAKEEDPFLILLDGVTDPHNLGAIIRTAECAGAHGVIVEERRAVGLTPAAVKASAGAVEHIPVARVVNLTSVIETLKARNIWVYGADMRGEDYGAVDFHGAAALVIGAEGEGVGRRVLESCDKTVSIPLKGQLDSLNASVAAGVLMYAVMRAR